MMGWQPIETAPKDGTEVLGIYVCDWSDHTTIYGPWTMRFGRHEWEPSWDNFRVIESESAFGTTYRDLDEAPTHWMPLPEPPTKKAPEP